MADILIRGLSDAAIELLDAEAVRLGISRVELLRRRLEADVPTGGQPSMTSEDWQRFATDVAGLADPDVVADAWR